MAFELSKACIRRMRSKYHRPYEGEIYEGLHLRADKWVTIRASDFEAIAMKAGIADDIGYIADSAE